jgi:ATP-binding cassette, subfamily B, bacterial RtxE
VSTPAETLNDTSWTQLPDTEYDPQTDSGLLSLVEILKHFDIPADLSRIHHNLGKGDVPTESIDLIRSALGLGLRGREAPIHSDRLAVAPTPLMVKNKDSGAFFVITSAENEGAQLLNPVTGNSSFISAKAISNKFEHDAVFFMRTEDQPEAEKKFGFAWFLPSIFKHVARFRRVIIASLFIQMFAIASPKLFQVVIDKVLVSRGLQSLDVLAIGLLCIAFFDPIMNFFRGLIYSHMASCVNSELSSRLFRHLVLLPLNYFQKRKAGDIIARVRELDNIRNFLTGSALMLVIDLMFVGVFIAIMFSYAPQLAGIVIGSLAVYFLFWLGFGPFLRKRVERQFENNAANTAFLTESITGMETIKSLGVSDRFNREWENRLAGYLKSSFSTSMMGNWAGGSIGLVQKITSAILLWFGVKLVMAGDLTVGELIAFNMLAGHVTMPILRMAQVWQDFQHTNISIRRIGDILNEPTESVTKAGRSSLEQVEGDIELRKVTFRYDEDGQEVLRRLDLKIEAGQTIGITGLSGSGKSTITKLIQKLYVPQSGQVLIDGVDLAMTDPSLLRRRLGVVLQDNFLFNGTIYENIALGCGNVNEEVIQKAAELSGTAKFCAELPGGLETQVGERGGSLSGGQRQRVAIARALAADPSILIFDEATSALDYETEAEIINRLPEICKNRTTIMIAHRLNAMRLCDKVIVMDKGEIIEEGTHEALLEQGGQYAHLWNLQNA